MKKEMFEEAQKIYTKITSIESLISSLKDDWVINIVSSCSYYNNSVSNQYKLDQLNISKSDLISLLEKKKENLTIQFETI